MGVGVKKAGGDGKSAQVINHGIVAAESFPNPENFVILNQNIPDVSVASCSVIDFTVFQQLLQRNTSSYIAKNIISMIIILVNF